MNMLNLYNKVAGLPLGKRIFSKMVCIKAPYFNTIKPLFEELKAGKCVITMKKRRSVHNHIGTVHAIAMCNISELAAGTMLEASIPKDMRWIPKKMSVEYLQVAKTDLKAVCALQEVKWEGSFDLPITVDVTDKANNVVFRAVIAMYVSPKK